MTDDTLIQFAAEKLGVAFVWQLVGVQGDRHRLAFLKDSGASFAPLTDWDLLRQGMRCVSWTCRIVVDGAVGSGVVVMYHSPKYELDGTGYYENIADIPRAFWTAWYNLEHHKP